MSTFPLLCETCGRWFGHARAYDRHVAGQWCADDSWLRAIGMIQDSESVWWNSAP